MSMPATFHVYVVADRNAMRHALTQRTSAALYEAGLSPGQVSIHPLRTVEDALSRLFGNPSHMPAVIVCWDTQPPRAQKLLGRPACKQREHETTRLVRALAPFSDLHVPVIGVACDVSVVPNDKPKSDVLGDIPTSWLEGRDLFSSDDSWTVRDLLTGHRCSTGALSLISQICLPNAA